MKENARSVIDLNAYTKQLMEKYGENNIVMPDGVHFAHFGRSKQGGFMAKEIERPISK